MPCLKLLGSSVSLSLKTCFRFFWWAKSVSHLFRMRVCWMLVKGTWKLSFRAYSAIKPPQSDSGIKCCASLSGLLSIPKSVRWAFDSYWVEAVIFNILFIYLTWLLDSQHLLDNCKSQKLLQACKFLLKWYAAFLPNEILNIISLLSDYQFSDFNPKFNAMSINQKTIDFLKELNATNPSTESI